MPVDLRGGATTLAVVLPSCVRNTGGYDCFYKILLMAVVACKDIVNVSTAVLCTLYWFKRW